MIGIDYIRRDRIIRFARSPEQTICVELSDGERTTAYTVPRDLAARLTAQVPPPDVFPQKEFDFCRGHAREAKSKLARKSAAFSSRWDFLARKPITTANKKN